MCCLVGVVMLGPVCVLFGECCCVRACVCVVWWP